MRKGNKAAFGAVICLALGIAPLAQANEPVSPESVAPANPDLALMGTIPIFWGESARLEDLLGGGATPHWARAHLERTHTLVPLDFLHEDALAGHGRLLLAQPRGLAPEENVALDAWVRRGGSLLLFADPLMTGESRFGLGDRRRPQDVALLSPILAHWGLRLDFDEDQPAGSQLRDIAGIRVPVNLPGSLALLEGAEASCRLGEHAILSECRLSAGRIVILADAALLDLAGPWTGAEEALDRLMALAFARGGENAGEDGAPGVTPPNVDENPRLIESTHGSPLSARQSGEPRTSRDDHLVPH